MNEYMHTYIYVHKRFPNNINQCLIIILWKYLILSYNGTVSLLMKTSCKFDKHLSYALLIHLKLSIH